MKKLFIIVLTLLFSIQLVTAKTLETDVTSPQPNCTMMALKGEYVVDIQKAIDRINEIREEAVIEGLVSDYVPIKWSSDLEWIARIRAAEASAIHASPRTNGDNCDDISHNGITPEGECRAWNNSKSMLNAIEQWYKDKANFDLNAEYDFTDYGVLIDPNYEYIGIGTFLNKDVKDLNSTVAEFSTKKSLDETRGKANGQVMQKVEVHIEYQEDYKISGNSKLTVGVPKQVYLKSNVFYTLNSKWSANNKNAVVSNGKITGKKVGKVQITAKADGKKVTKTYTVNPQNASGLKVTGKKKVLKATWKKQKTQTTGYEVRYSLKSSMKSSKTKTLKNTKKSLKVKGLKSKKTYYVQIRTYKKIGKTKYYSDWSTKVQVKIK